jgi:four helix bundle protein
VNNERAMGKKNIIKDKSFSFALRIVKAYKYLTKEKNEFVLSKQLLRCGTAIGALAREAEYAQSLPDFINKMTVALKEANETEYWLMLLKESEYIDNEVYSSVINDCQELLRLLISTINTSKKKLNKKDSVNC